MRKRDVWARVAAGRVWVVLALLFVSAFAGSATAQTRRSTDRLGNDLVSMRLNEITLEAIDFRDQTARLNLGLDISTPIPVSLKDFDYRLRLFDTEVIEGNYGGALKLGGRRGAQLDLPVVVNLRSIPNVVWSAFSNRGQVRYEFDTAFTLPLYVFERRFDKSFAGEVPLRSLVDAASILRAQRGATGGRGTTSSPRWGDIIPRW
ncbi:MAG TPA: hypothetical protein VGW12_01200 [Pyrinomonadaceae bacterium]|nr:hypothetical protein [Pyrinomonadaceae bacterium]